MDVEEANRLILAALQTSAVDPKTGKIDLDLVTTGISSWGRQVHALQRNAVRRVINELEKATMPWAEVFRAFNSQSDEQLAESDFNGILRDLTDEGFIHITGRNNSEKVIKKMRA